MRAPPTVLAATVHDPEALLVDAMARLGPLLRAMFAEIALNISDASAPAIAASARSELGAKVMIHAAGEAIIGRARRDAAALAAGPRRLQETERLVNHAYALMTGQSWDLMFAIRRLSDRAAQTIVQYSQVDTLANDVEWPLLARQAGLTSGYVQSDALFYRTIEDFGAPADTGDDDPLQWIRRLEFAAQHATAMRPFLK